MHVLVATDGSVDTDKAAAFAGALAGADGSTTVGTVVRVPRRMVHDLREQYGDQDPVHVDSDGEYVGSPKSGAMLEKGFPGEDALINQYLGDAIMALFPSSADSALRCAVEIARAMTELGTRREAEGKPVLPLGLGIHRGPLMLGALGGGSRLDCHESTDQNARCEQAAGGQSSCV